MVTAALRAWALGIAASMVAALPAPAADNTIPPVTGFSVVAVGTGPEPLPLRPTHLGVRWTGDPDASLQLRYAVDGHWRPWHDMEAVPDLDDPERAVRHAGLVWAEGATTVQVRAGRGASRPEVVAIDARDAGGYRSAEHVRVSADGGPAGPPPVITRAGWGADESKRRDAREYARISKLVVHHTVTPNNDPDPASTVRAIYAYHTQSRGWDDIGYHFLVDAAGRVYEGRFARQYAPGEVPTGENNHGAGVVGAHAQGHNHGSAGVALLGDFHGAQPTPAAVDGLVAVLSWKAARNGIDPYGAAPFTTTDGRTYRFPNVAGHRDVGQTQCPGDHLYAALPNIRQRVGERLGMAPPPAPQAPPPPPPAPAPEPPPPPIPGFWAARADGSVVAFGDADPPGSPNSGLAQPVAGMATTPSGRGYWLVAADGTVAAAGDAQVFPPATAIPVVPPVVRLEPTPPGAGYWLVSRDGGVVPYGDARWFGSVPAGTVAPVVGMAVTPTGAGYWVAAADGKVFAFGDAATTGGGLAAPAPVSAPVTSIAASPTGAGYWLLTADGNVVPVGVPGHGRADTPPPLRSIQIRATETGEGYYVAATDGALFTFGDAEPRRQRPGDAGSPEVVDVALRPLRRATP